MKKLIKIDICRARVGVTLAWFLNLKVQASLRTTVEPSYLDDGGGLEDGGATAPGWPARGAGLPGGGSVVIVAICSVVWSQQGFRSSPHKSKDKGLEGCFRERYCSRRKGTTGIYLRQQEMIQKGLSSRTTTPFYRRVRLPGHIRLKSEIYE